MHARTYRQSQPLPLAALDPTVIGVGPESILWHGTTNAVSVWPDAWRGHETTRGRQQHLQIAMTSPDGRLSRHLRRKGARRARQRRAAGVQGACGAAVLMCAHGAAHDVPSAERAERAFGRGYIRKRRLPRRVGLIAGAHTALTCVCAPAVEVELRRLRGSGMYPLCLRRVRFKLLL